MTSDSMSESERRLVTPTVGGHQLKHQLKIWSAITTFLLHMGQRCGIDSMMMSEQPPQTHW